MKNIEIEVRSFITKKEYEKLQRILKKEAKFIDSIEEETVYFEAKNKDLRLRKNEKEAFLILKEGKIHDDSREEIEVRIKRDDFSKIEKIFKRLGYRDKIRWFRKRMVFESGGIKILLDDTKGYGLILELEKIGTAKEKEKIHKYLEQKIKSLGIKITSRKVFEKKFKYYKNNWRKILK